MIKPAQLYTEELKRLYCETWYDPKYMYYRGWTGSQDLQIPDNCYDSHAFAILDNNEVIGYITYAVNFITKVADRFGIISFKPSIIFGIDLMKIIDDIFIKYKMNKIEFCCISGNPVLKHYYRFIEKFGGREVGVYKQSVMLTDGELHDEILFELFAKDYLFCKKIKKPPQIKKDSILRHDTKTYLIS